jgi:glycosyltransferase involved in cell wall biosynthesis
MHNEIDKGNLKRCLENVKSFCDSIVIYDDASTDGSVELAKQYTPHIIVGEKNDWQEERAHKQLIMNYAKNKIKPDWFLWIDCDEILDRNGVNNIKKAITQMVAQNKTSASFHQLNLWRGHNWQRLDGHFNSSWFLRLWKNTPIMNFDTSRGCHKRMHPLSIGTADCKLNFRIIHYGFSDYNQIPDHCWNWDFKSYGEGRYKLYYESSLVEVSWIMNESKCNTKLVHPEVFPISNVPKNIVVKPQPFIFQSVEHVEKVLTSDSTPAISDMTYVTETPKLNLLDFYHNSEALII